MIYADLLALNIYIETIYNLKIFQLFPNML